VKEGEYVELEKNLEVADLTNKKRPVGRQQPPVPFQASSFETFGGLHADELALLQRPNGLLNQAIIAHKDVEGYFVMRRVSFIIAAAVGRQLTTRQV
jgi:hypothetical protein